MNLSLSIDELLGYTDGERAKWERWFRGQPPAVVASPVQRDGRFSTVWRLLDRSKAESWLANHPDPPDPTDDRLGGARLDGE